MKVMKILFGRSFFLSIGFTQETTRKERGGGGLKSAGEKKKKKEEKKEKKRKKKKRKKKKTKRKNSNCQLTFNSTPSPLCLPQKFNYPPIPQNPSWFLQVHCRTETEFLTPQWTALLF